jgi:hypothetical protein
MTSWIGDPIDPAGERDGNPSPAGQTPGGGDAYVPVPSPGDQEQERTEGEAVLSLAERQALQLAKVARATADLKAQQRRDAVKPRWAKKHATPDVRPGMNRRMPSGGGGT